MAILKCKMCGGDLTIQDSMTVAECEYCGTTQTLPKLVSDDIANLYDRANHFRRNNEFDKAEGIYERILSQTPEDSEAYWSLVLCRYGIEYVEDPATGKRVPTVNRTQYTSIFDDENYKSAIEHADAIQRRVYEEEAAAINEIQKGILAISQKEEPFDVFICYKETDRNGRRTPDSVLATDLYHQLTNEGFKVFFARITLEDKLGSAYEPYIFAALNSAKVMVVLGTKPEYFNAVWVKNEWSRYLALVNKSGGKKVLIPAYRDIDPYDLPEEFSHLQAQDMSKLGFIQDLIRGIKKITASDTPKPQVQTVTVNAGASDIAPLFKRMFMYLEDGEWEKANEYAERVLDKDPENGEAYVGKLMMDLKVHHRESLKDQAQPFDGNRNYQKAVRFGSEKIKSELIGNIKFINDRNAEEKRRQEEERRKQEEERKEQVYNEAVEIMNSASTEDDWRKAADLFSSASGYKDADKQLAVCENRIKELSDKKAEEEKIAVKKKKKRITTFGLIAATVIAIVITFVIVLNTIIIPNQKYDAANAKQYADAVSLMNTGTDKSIEQAKTMFEELSDYKDSKQLAKTCNDKLNEKASNFYNSALGSMEKAEYQKAYEKFGKYPDYLDSSDKMQECLKNLFSEAVSLYNEKEYSKAFSIFKYCKEKGYSADETTEYMDKCNESYKAMIQAGVWLDVDTPYPIISYQGLGTVNRIRYHYKNNTIEFSVDYSIKKNEFTDDASYYFGGDSSPYLTDFAEDKLNLDGNNFTFSIDYEKLILGFRNGDFSKAVLMIDYPWNSTNAYDSVNMFFHREIWKKETFTEKHFNKTTRLMIIDW